MKRWKLRSGIALAMAALSATTGCSVLKIQSDISIKAVPIDLTFGAEKPTTKPQPPANLLRDPVQPPLQLPIDPKIVTPPVAPTIFCPPNSAISARDKSEPQTTANQRPKEGHYLFNYSGNLADHGAAQLIGYKDIAHIQPEFYNGAPYGFSYSVYNAFNHVTMWFQVQFPTEANAANQADTPGAAGLYLKRLDIPSKDTGTGPEVINPFIPASAQAPGEGGLLLVPFPIQNGREYDDQDGDVAVKQGNGVPNPQGGTLFGPSSNTIRSAVQVGGREIIDVCDELAQAWKINWTIEISGQYTHTIVGSFWLATQYGGWPIREDYVMDGDLESGNFYDSMMKLDPGNYL